MNDTGFDVLDPGQGTTLRALTRIVVLYATSYLWKLPTDQVVLIQSAVELAIQLLVRSPLGNGAGESVAQVPFPEPVAADPPATPTVATPSPSAPAAPTSPDPWPTDPSPIDNGEGYDAPIGGD